MLGNVRQKIAPDFSPILVSNIFSNLSPAERAAIIGWTGITQFRKGGLLFSPGRKADHLYYLVSGLVRIFKPQKGSGNNEVARFTPGDIIGDFDFARDAEYDAYAEALEDSTLIVFPGSGLSLEKFAVEEPRLSSRLLLNATAMVTERIKATRRLIIESAYWVKELHRKIHEDSATGLWKQTLITEEINELLENPMALIMLKPDRFKILVDSQGHSAGDEAMIKIAALLKNITRRLDRGWALRFKSNETGLLVNKCDVALAETLAVAVFDSLAALPPVPLDGGGKFSFTGSVSFGIWPDDDNHWDSLFAGTYKLMMDTWKEGGNKITHYRKRAGS